MACFFYSPKVRPFSWHLCSRQWRRVSFDYKVNAAALDRGGYMLICILSG